MLLEYDNRDVLDYYCFIYFRLNVLLQEIGQNQEPGAKTLIFVETKRKAENITRNIRRYGWPAVCMHGDKTQQERDEVLYQFKQGRASILVATDVAARGLGKNSNLSFYTDLVLMYFMNSMNLQLFNLHLFYTFRGTGGKLLCSIRILPEIKRHVTALDLYLRH